MSAFNGWRWLAFAGVVLLIGWATGSSGKQLPSLSPQTPQQPPSPLDALKGTLPQPEIPQVPSVLPVAANPPVVPSVTPTVPPLPAKAVPVAPAFFPPPVGVPVSQIPAVVTPSALEITEPVATVHRFAGKYLGSDGRRAVLYVETGDGKAEVQSRPLAPTIPDADANALDDVKRIAVPVGKVAHRDGRAFVTTSRELLVIGINCEIEWRFTLPGKPDNGETLLDVAGFHGKTVILASRQVPQPGDKAAPGRLYTFDAASGRQVAFATVAEGFDEGTRFALDRSTNAIFAVGPKAVRAFDLDGGNERWRQQPFTGTHVSTARGVLLSSTPAATGAVFDSRFVVLLSDMTLTAPVGADAHPHDHTIYLPTRSVSNGEYSLSAFAFPTIWEQRQLWRFPMKQAITAAPVVRGESVYFVAGNVLYRVNAATGAICWKHTLALNPGESLTELAFVGDELRASGPGVFVRVTERPSPPAPTLIPGAVQIPPAPGQ